MNRKKFIFLSSTGLVGAGITGLSPPAFLESARAAEHLEFRTLGRTGLKVSAVGFGPTSIDIPGIAKRALDMGVNFIDTGRMYASGKNEEMVGRVIKDIRKKIIIQTKFTRRYKDDRKAIEKSIDDSLKALRTDYIDIMLLHSASSEEDLKSPAVLEVLTKARKSGKIRFCGFSSHSSESYKILRAGVEAEFYDIAMIPYNHAGHFHHTVYKGFYCEWDQDALEKEMERAVACGMGIVAMKTCSAGPLKKEGESTGTYQACLKWILRNKNVSTMAVSMRNFRDADEDVGAMG